jgi:hypothetical protein
VVALALVISVAIVANLFTVGRAVQALVFSQKRQLHNAISKSKGDGFIHQLRSEVNLMTNMVSSTRKKIINLNFERNFDSIIDSYPKF